MFDLIDVKRPCPLGVSWCDGHSEDAEGVQHLSTVVLEFDVGTRVDAVDRIRVYTSVVALFDEPGESRPMIGLELYRDDRPGATMGALAKDFDAIMTPADAERLGRALLEAAARVR